MPRALVLVLTHNSYHTIRACLESLERALGSELEAATLVVDNASTDGTVEEVRTRFPRLRLIESDENLGYAAGNNRGIRTALELGCEFVYLLNPDARVEAGFLEEACAAMDGQPAAAAVQSLLLLEPDGERIDSSGNRIHFLGFGLCEQHGAQRAEAPSAGRDIGFASGAAVLLRLSALADVGLLEERLFLYCEDLDLCWRLRMAGYGIRLAPGSVVLHRHEFARNPEKYFYLERNRWLVLLRVASARTLLLLAPALLASELAILLLALRSGWAGQKLRALAALVSLDTWRYLASSRREIQRRRRLRDREVMRDFTSRMELEYGRSWLLERIANPVLGALWRILARLL